MSYPTVRLLNLPASHRPVITVIVDTEEEFDWDGPFDPNATRTTNIELQHYAQAIFERHGVIPTYAMDFPVANSPAARGRCCARYWMPGGAKLAPISILG
jgi:hypothetical protein